MIQKEENKDSPKIHFFSSVEDIPIEIWRWPNFTPYEICCKGSGSIIIDEIAMDCLQKLRTLMEAPIIINSGYRNPSYNHKVGGKINSLHVKGRAFDISLQYHPHRKLFQYGKKAGFTGFGLYDSFIHMDTGLSRTWVDKTYSTLWQEFSK
jgi:hypothetical protein